MWDIFFVILFVPCFVKKNPTPICLRFLRSQEQPVGSLFIIDDSMLTRHLQLDSTVLPRLHCCINLPSYSGTSSPHTDIYIFIYISNMAWTTRELEILQITSRVSSVFSLLGASFIIITFCSSTSFHRPINRLAFFAAFGNILSNVATITSREGIVHGSDSALCKAQASLIQW